MERKRAEKRKQEEMEKETEERRNKRLRTLENIVMKGFQKYLSIKGVIFPIFVLPGTQNW